MGNKKYLEIVFGSSVTVAVFAKYRKPFRRQRMTRNRALKLVEKGTKMIIHDSLCDSSYDKEMMNIANWSRNSPQMPRDGT